MELAQGFFYVSVGIGVWVVIAVLVLLLIESLKTIKTIRRTATKVSSSINSISLLQSGLKMGVTSFLTSLFTKKISKSKGGEQK